MFRWNVFFSSQRVEIWCMQQVFSKTSLTTQQSIRCYNVEFHTKRLITMNLTFMGPCIVRIFQYVSNRCNITQFILPGICSTCFGWYFHPSSGAHTTVSTASGICHTVTAICCYRGKVGTGLSVLWVAYATHSTLKPVPARPR